MDSSRLLCDSESWNALSFFPPYKPTCVCLHDGTLLEVVDCPSKKLHADAK